MFAAAADPKLVADVLVNLFGALGTLVVAYDLRRSDPHGPVTGRAIVAFWLVAALFLARCLAWSTESRFLAGLVDILAVATPLAGLIVAEGLLRRHAPRWIKLSILCGGVTAALLVVLPSVPTIVRGLVELIVVAGGFGLIGFLLWTRDRSNLTKAENSGVRSLVIAMALLVPLIATDFRSIWPEIPLRFGAVGALVLMFFVFGPGRSTSGERVGSLLGFLAIAALFAVGTLSSGVRTEPGQAVRITAVGLCGLIVAALFSEVLGTRAERRRPADPLLTARGRAEFADALKRHRLLGNALILEDDDVAPLRHPAFDALIAERPVLKRADLPWGRNARDDGVERAASLLIAHDATHILRLSQQPMRLALFALPQMSSDVRAESEIAAVQRIGELLFSGVAPT
jgi:hypothetical protein